MNDGTSFTTCITVSVACQAFDACDSCVLLYNCALSAQLAMLQRLHIIHHLHHRFCGLPGFRCLQLLRAFIQLCAFCPTCHASKAATMAAAMVLLKGQNSSNAIVQDLERKNSPSWSNDHALIDICGIALQKANSRAITRQPRHHLICAKVSRHAAVTRNDTL
jgi:hypothetical protein